MNKIQKLKEVNGEINLIIRDLQAKCFILNTDNDRQVINEKIEHLKLNE